MEICLAQKRSNQLSRLEMDMDVVAMLGHEKQCAPESFEVMMYMHRHVLSYDKNQYAPLVSAYLGICKEW